MNAKIQCSNCGAEITNLTMSWGKKYWLFSLLAFLPMLFLLFWMNGRFFGQPANMADEIQATLIESHIDDSHSEVFGTLTNIGTRTWNRVTIEAEVYDQDGKFLGEGSEYLTVLLAPGDEENFQISSYRLRGLSGAGEPKVVLKVVGGDDGQF